MGLKSNIPLNLNTLIGNKNVNTQQILRSYLPRIKDSIRSNFSQKRNKDGTTWKNKKDKTPSTLIKSGKLYKTSTNLNIKGNQVYSNPIFYGEFHNFGIDKQPKREFLYVNDKLEKEIEDKIRKDEKVDTKVSLVSQIIKKFSLPSLPSSISIPTSSVPDFDRKNKFSKSGRTREDVFKLYPKRKKSILFSKNKLRKNIYDIINYRLHQFKNHPNSIPYTKYSYNGKSLEKKYIK